MLIASVALTNTKYINNKKVDKKFKLSTDYFEIDILQSFSCFKAIRKISISSCMFKGNVRQSVRNGIGET